MADPVADFLQREQNLLAELDGDAPPPTQDVPPAFVEDFGQMAVADPPSHTNDFGVDSAFADMSAASNLDNSASQNGRSSTGPSPVPMVPKIEAENIRRWREQQREMLEKKDAAEEKKKAEWKSQAKKDLEEWNSQRDASLVKAKENNRKLEAEHAAQRQREQGSEAAWDEIAKLCESKPKGSTKDVSRMKTLLLHLKELQNQ
ncbi:unnamed protein product, partial [Mesorhabditis belari]|uniref:Clathrin light chain n=1 Tax=Mesorhabditis belari TaxID=2138241 RepID=A0AAF3F2W6_9BILA